ncbi:MAG TPA: hydantoinase/oxoprolinase family protein [Burkholderiales bacterium]
MAFEFVTGWDLGGAHLKAAAVDGDGRVVDVMQVPCPLWLGMEQLDAAMGLALEKMPGDGLHVVTMTGELTDFFKDRAEGVRAIISRFGKHVPQSRTLVYAGTEGFLKPAKAAGEPGAVASANWAASAQLVAARIPDALFIDIGSTTTDIVPIVDGIPAITAYGDAGRLACEELVYTGVVRTPVMALASRIPFEGAWIRPMAEYFATTADVYRLTGELPEGADQLPAADNGDKSVRASARRLARMLGRDVESAPLAAWKQCARHLADCQLTTIREACERILSGNPMAARTPVIAAGVGRFVARKLAAQLGRPYREFDRLIGAAANPWVSSCAPAVAVALLALRAQSMPLRHGGRQARR